MDYFPSCERREFIVISFALIGGFLLAGVTLGIMATTAYRLIEAIE